MARTYEVFFLVNVPSGLQGAIPYQYPPVSPEAAAKLPRARDVISFCFPDLDEIRKVRAENFRGDFYTFTLTDAEGSRIFGVVYRSLANGFGLRYDVGKRHPECLCFLTR
jgi:hypothetical protein